MLRCFSKPRAAPGKLGAVVWSGLSLSRLGVCFSLVAGGGLGALALANWLVISSTRSQVHDDVVSLPDARVALLLGCSPWVKNGRKNLYFEYRLNAAAKLYHNGKVSKVLVSGDNGTLAYNEPRAMTLALVKRGVPREDIALDYAGFRTLDSVVRAGEIFGLREFIVVSQAFHNHRALYIANQYGYRVSAFNAQDVSGRRALRTQARELLARVRMLLDVHLLHTEPRLLGRKETI